MSSVAEHLADQLWRAGVDTVYGLPGGENVELLDALRRRGFRFLLVRSESAACFMAATDARIRGTIGVALTTLGPGATNAYAGFAHAFLDRAPVLLLTAASDPDLRGRHTHQVLDLQAIFDPVSKFTAELSAANAKETIGATLRIAKQGRPGPVHLSLHNSVALEIVGKAGTESPQVENASPGDIRLFQDIMRGKTKPIIVAGLGLEPDQPYEQLRHLAESLNAPVIDTPKAKGALSAEHALFAGTIGLTRDDPVYALLEESDCIIAIGFDVVELVKPWDQPQPLIWIANWENADPTLPFALSLVGQIGQILERLPRPAIAENAAWGKARVASFRREQDSIAHPAAAKGRITPQDLLRSLRANTPDDIIISTDVGSHKIFMALNWAARLPNRYFVSNGLSAMGFGISSAIAAADCTGEPVVCITGDAGLALALGELGLLAELQLPVIVMVLNDAALDLIRSAQTRQGRATFGTEFSNPDFAGIAAAYGMDYCRVTCADECDEALRRGLARGKPMLLDVMIDPAGYPTTPGVYPPSVQRRRLSRFIRGERM